MKRKIITYSPLDELEDLIVILAQEVIKAQRPHYKPSIKAIESAKWLLGEQNRKPRKIDP